MSNDQLSRRAAVIGLAFSPGVAMAAEKAPVDEVRETLLGFLHAFENCDLAAMQAGFADDAFCFDPTLMSREGTASIDVEEFRRKTGMSPTMRRICTAAPKGAGPRNLNPVDLAIQMGTDMAVCSFHLDSPQRLGRRTIVLAKRGGAWKIVHLHASNVQTP